MKISKNVELEVDLEMDELAKIICDGWNDEQAQLLLAISNIVSDNKWQAQNQIYSIGKYVHDSLTPGLRQRVKDFIGMLNDLIVDFEKNKESESNGNYECKDN